MTTRDLVKKLEARARTLDENVFENGEYVFESADDRELMLEAARKLKESLR